MGKRALFSSGEIEAISKVIGNTLTGTEIRTRLAESGIPTDLTSTGTKRWYLKETLETWQEVEASKTDILLFLEAVMTPINYVGRTAVWESLLAELNQALAFCGYRIQDDGTIIGTEAVTTLQRSTTSPTPSSAPNYDFAPPSLLESLAAFRRTYPDESKTAFIMMHFGATPAHAEIVDAIKSILNPHNLKALRADEAEYHPDTFSNIQTYMHGCGFGIAVFERIESETFNPNVALEVGYMYALGKRVCLVKDKTLRTLPADLMGKLYRPFDPQSIEKSLSPVLADWLKNYNFI